jgi:hypothetical protein
MPQCRAEVCGAPSGRLCHDPLWHYGYIEASGLWKCFYHHPPKAYMSLCTTCARICHLHILTRSAHTVVLVFPALDNLGISATRLWQNVPGVCSVCRLLSIRAGFQPPVIHDCPFVAQHSFALIASGVLPVEGDKTSARLLIHVDCDVEYSVRYPLPSGARSSQPLEAPGPPFFHVCS